MKIGSSPHDLSVPDLSLRNARSAGTAAPAASAPGASSDRVALSSAASQLGSASGGDFDQNKVDAIRDAISSGRFSINAGKIADALIADAAALLAPRNAN